MSCFWLPIVFHYVQGCSVVPISLTKKLGEEIDNQHYIKVHTKEQPHSSIEFISLGNIKSQLTQHTEVMDQDAASFCSSVGSRAEKPIIFLRSQRMVHPSHSSTQHLFIITLISFYSCDFILQSFGWHVDIHLTSVTHHFDIMCDHILTSI